MNYITHKVQIVGNFTQVEGFKRSILKLQLPIQICEHPQESADVFILLGTQENQKESAAAGILEKTLKQPIEVLKPNMISYADEIELIELLSNLEQEGSTSCPSIHPRVYLPNLPTSSNTNDIPGLIGNSEKIKALKKLILRLSFSRKPVLITGPTGSGKELVARGLHENSPLKNGPMVSINCGALPESLMESLFFGHEKGAFTGADKQQHGYFHQANHGTLFLDELGETPLLLQAKLLRVLESGKYSRIGSNEEQEFKGRIIAATHVNLIEAVKNRAFREDLYYRLNVLTIETPSLNDRREDIPVLIEHFRLQSERPVRFSSEAIEILSHNAWSGNVRQLKNAVERLCLLCDNDVVSAQCVSRILDLSPSNPCEELDRVARIILQMDLPDKRNAIIDALLIRALRESNGNKTEAARLLGVHRKVVERRFFTHLNETV